MMVEDMTRLFLRLLLRSTTKSMVWAATASLLALVWAQTWGLVMRVSAAGGAGLVVLLWMSKHSPQSPQ